MIKTARNVFVEGIDQDTALTSYKNTKYWKAENMRLYSADGESIGSLQNERGNTVSFKLPQSFDVFKIFGNDIQKLWGGTITIGGQAITIPEMEIGKIGAYLAGQSISRLGTISSSSTIPYYAYQVGSTGKMISRMGVITLWGSGIDTSGMGVTVNKTSAGDGELAFTQFNVDNSTIIGYTNMRNKLYLFTTNSNFTSTHGGGSIWQVEYNSNNTVTDASSLYLVPEIHLIYHDVLDFSLEDSIRATSYYFNESVGKLYWVDNYNKVRHLNVLDPTAMCLRADQLDIVGNVKFSQPLVTEIIQGGGYKVGAVQYAYQLYNLYGAETSVSPTSYIYNLAEKPYTLASSRYFIGSPAGDNSGKAVSVRIPYVDSRYDHIRLFSLFYESDEDIPIVRIVVDKKIAINIDVDIIDDGINFVGEYSFQEFRNYEKMLFSGKDLEIKDKRMVVGNINLDKFDVDYDARAYRHNSSGSFSIDSSAPIVGNATNWGNVGEYEDCVTGDYDTYKYQANGLTVGGEGINVSYAFSTVELPIDSSRDFFSMYSPKILQPWRTSMASQGDNLFMDNPYYGGYASPINAGQMVGYQRGETYRFGVVFYSPKGQRSPVKWIGDIRMPHSYENAATGSSYNIYTYKAIKSPAINTVQGKFGKYVLNTSSPVSYAYVRLKVTFGTASVTATKDFPVATAFLPEGHDEYVSGTGWESFYKNVKEWIFSIFGDTLEVSFEYTDDGTNLNQMNYYLVFRSKKYGETLNSTLNEITFGALDTATAFTDGTGSNDIYATIPVTPSAASTFMWDNVDNRMNATVLYPKFTLSNIPYDSDTGEYYSYEIVRVKRTDNDKQVIAQGILTSTIVQDDVYTPITAFTQSTKYNGTVANNTPLIASLNNVSRVNFISPDVSFRKVNAKAGDIVDVIGCFMDHTEHTQTNVEMAQMYAMTNYHDSTNRTITDSSVIETYRTLDETPQKTKISSSDFLNAIRLAANSGTSLQTRKPAALGGTSMFAVLNSTPAISSTYNSGIAICNIFRTNANQYGGNSYYARHNNTYISTGAFVSPETGSSTACVFGGDTYLVYFDYQRSFWDDNGQIAETIYVPVETTINLDYRYDKPYDKSIDRMFKNMQYLQAYAGDYSDSVGYQEPAYVQDYDLYLENKVYSRANNSLLYLPSAPDEDTNLRQDTRMYISEAFDYDSKNDNLIKFLPDNNTTLNTVYGEINALVNYKDYLYVFQDRAIGVQFINERSVVNDTTGSSLVIGTGDVAGRIQYITTSSGCQHPNSIVAADTGLYYFDAMGKSIYAVSGSDFNLVRQKGLSKYFNDYVASNLPNTQFLNMGIHGVYDEKNSRILWTYLNSNQGHYWTLSFSEVVKAFESFYSYYPCIFIKTFDNKILSVNKLNDATVDYHAYIHGETAPVCSYGNYYGTPSYSTIQLVVNEDPIVNKQFASIEFPFRVTTTEVKPGTGIDTYYDETISTVTFGNNYQTTAQLDVVTTTPIAGQIKAENRFRKWRIALPRVSSGGRNARIADTYLNIRFTYLNNNNKKIQLEDLITYYNPTIF